MKDIRRESAIVDLRNAIDEEQQSRKALDLERRRGFRVAIGVELRHEKRAPEVLEHIRGLSELRHELGAPRAPRRVT